MIIIKKLFIMFAILFLNLIFAYSFNVCNVDVSEPWLIASDGAGFDVLIVDGQGDMYFEGIGHSADDKNLMPSFSVGDNIHFNRVTSKFSDYNGELSSIPSVRGLEIQNSAGESVGLFGEDGIVYTKGQGIYEGSQAGCLDDGWLYCNVNGVTRENRDYYCKMLGSKTGFCDFNVLNSEDCSMKLSEDTDGGPDRWTAGTVTDYIDCSSGSCTFNTYSDVCTGATVLQEYSDSGSSYSSSLIDCASDNHYLCKNSIDKYERLYHCSVGKCEIDRDVFVQTCPTQSTSYGTWSCNTLTQKVRSNTVYSPTCTSGNCGISSSNVVEYENCPSGTDCSSGVCTSIVDCVGSWRDTSTCSESCDGGVKRQVYRITTPASPLGSSCPYSDGATRWGSTPCNTQACVAPCTVTSWTPSTGTVCSGDSFTQTSNCGTTRSATGTKDCTVACSITSWSPSPSTVCSGDSFTQTSNCGTSRSATGTKDCTVACVDSSWSPSPSTVCSGDSFTQTSNCGTSRSATGTKDCTPVCVDSSWSPSSSTVCSGDSFTQTSNCGTSRSATGTKDCTPVCTWSDCSCSGNQILECNSCTGATQPTGRYCVDKICSGGVCVSDGGGGSGGGTGGFDRS